MKIEKNNKNRNRSEKGITLIALIITIIVMLILVAVVVDVAIDGKLFDTAKDAVGQTNNKVGETQGRVDELMGELDEVEEWQESQKPKAKPGEMADTNLPYISDGKTAIIPAGFTVSGLPEESSIDEGLRILYRIIL